MLAGFDEIYDKEETFECESFLTQYKQLMGCSSSSAKQVSEKVRKATFSSKNVPNMEIKIKNIDTKLKTVEHKYPKGVVKVKEEFIHQHFLLQVESNTISIEDCEKYITSHRTALTATDAMGNTAIRFATMNRNLKLFLLLTKVSSGKHRDGA